MSSILTPQSAVEPTGLVAPCRVCSQVLAAVELVEGMCLECRVGRVGRPHFERYVHLQRKRARLAAVAPPGALAGVDGQIARCLRDAWTAIQMAMPGETAAVRHKRAQPFMNRFLRTAAEALRR